MFFSIMRYGIEVRRGTCSDVGGALGSPFLDVKIVKLVSRRAARGWVERFKAWQSRPQICAVEWCEERAEEGSDYCHVHNQPAWREDLDRTE